ncbi:CBS domain-containing protein [Phaeovulum sp.]|uniref:CBS domain-containing protein n=1 Tax=Phaeovulum sp. TaxID=2934796 RepID=UPI003566CB0F
MAFARDILASKGTEVHCLGPDDKVLEALKLMASQNVGSVIITEGDAVIGIFTERKYAREVFLKGRAAPNTPIRDVMETEVLSVSPDDSVETCMAMMSDRRIRHLPVIKEGRLEGIISIGDLMKSIIDAREFDIDQLVKYVRS